MKAGLQTRRRRIRWVLLVGMALCVGPLAFSQPTAKIPPTAEVEFESAVTGACHLDGASPGASGTTLANSLEVATRGPLNWPGLYWRAGIQADRFDFTGGPFRRLQDYAGVVGLEYYRDGEQAAELKLHPGWYFDDHASAKAWDIPVDLISGVPISRSVNGVVGFSNARFYHHPLPIFGLVWTPTSDIRVQLVYPETAVEYTLSRSVTVRLGGELVGGGFLARDATGHDAPVEYSSYRVGLGVTRTWAPGCKIGVSAGAEALREFDAFRSTGRSHGSGAGYVSLNVTLAR